MKKHKRIHQKRPLWYSPMFHAMKTEKKSTQTRSFLLKLRRLAPPLELGNMLATGLRKKPDGRETTCNISMHNAKLRDLML